MGFSVRMDSVIGDSDGNDRGGCCRIRAIFGPPPACYIGDQVHHPADTHWIQLCDFTFYYATGGDSGDCAADMDEQPGYPLRKDRSKLVHSSKNGCSVWLDCFGCVRGTECRSRSREFRSFLAAD